MMVFLIGIFAGIFVLSLITFTFLALSEKKPVKEKKGIMETLSDSLDKIHPAFVKEFVNERLWEHFQEKGFSMIAEPYRVLLKGEAMGIILFLFLYVFFSSLKLAFFGFAAGIFIPYLDIRSRRKEFEKKVVRDFPFFLDLAGISVEAGVDFSIAMERTSVLLPDGPVKDGIKRAVEEIKLGKTRREALENLSKNLAVKEVNDFVSAVVQAERMGTGLLNVIKNFSEELRRKRFEDAEKRAQEVPVKLMGPLLLIFICNFIVIIAPIIVRALRGGILK